MILCETWIDSKGWEKINMKLSKGYIYMGDTMGGKKEHERKSNGRNDHRS